MHSTGLAGGPAERTIEVEVTVAPIDLPKGIFGRTINLGGTVDLEQISIFTTGCVYKRDKITSQHYAAGLDAAYGVPIGVHSSQVITESQGSGQYCSNTTRPIHDGLNLLGISLKPCNSAYPYDQDRFGGSLTQLPLLGGLMSLVPCAAASALPAYIPRDVDLNGTLDVNGSFLRDDQALFRTFGITRPALTDAADRTAEDHGAGAGDLLHLARRLGRPGRGGESAHRAVLRPARPIRPSTSSRWTARCGPAPASRTP